MRFNKCCVGNTLAEYGIIGALVIVVALTGLLYAGGHFKDLLSGLKDDMKGNIAAADNQKALNSAAQLVAAQWASGNGGGQILPAANVIQGYEKVCVSDGVCANVPLVVDGAVQTAGVNGGELTSEFANVIEQLANEILKDPNADVKLAVLASLLANQGHVMGDFQQQFTTSSSQSVDMVSSSSSGSTASVEGVQPTIEAGNKLDMLQNSMLTEFKDLNQAVKEHIAENPGSISKAGANLIAQAAQNITTIAEGFQTVTSTQSTVQTVGTTGSSNGTQLITTTSTTTFVNNAQLTQDNANTICKIGANSIGCMQ